MSVVEDADVTLRRLQIKRDEAVCSYELSERVHHMNSLDKALLLKFLQHGGIERLKPQAVAA